VKVPAPKENPTQVVQSLYWRDLEAPPAPILTVYVPEHRAMKAYWGSGCIAPRIDLGTVCRRVVTLTPRPLYPQGKRPWYGLNKRVGGPQSRPGRGGEKNFQSDGKGKVKLSLCLTKHRAMKTNPLLN